MNLSILSTNLTSWVDLKFQDYDLSGRHLRTLLLYVLFCQLLWHLVFGISFISGLMPGFDQRLGSGVVCFLGEITSQICFVHLLQVDRFTFSSEAISSEADTKYQVVCQR